MSRADLKIFIVTFLLLLLVAGSVGADEELPQKGQDEPKAAVRAAGAVLKLGPAEIPIADQAVLHLPEGYGYIPSPQSIQFLKALDFETGEGHQGVIVPIRKDGGKSWLMVVSFYKVGYIKDDDPRSWKTDELLKQILNNTETTNKILRAKGFWEMEFMGWVEPPAYDPANHRLVWSVAFKDKGRLSSIQGVDYSTLALGREGYISMQLTANRERIESLRPVARNLLASFSYNDGKKYTDFNAGTDKVASYGLAAVVTGKLGVLIPHGATSHRFGKAHLVTALGIGLMMLFGCVFIIFRIKKKRCGSSIVE